VNKNNKDLAYIIKAILGAVVFAASNLRNNLYPHYLSPAFMQVVYIV
jgi:hypothetical protein